jgi:long-chain acyl-CoA synthetase
MLAPRNIIKYLLENSSHDSDRCVYIWKNNNITASELRGRIFGFANQLKQLALRPQDKVIVAMDDCPEWIVAFDAMVAMGIIPVVVDSRFTDDKINDIIKRTNSVAVLTDHDRCVNVRQIYKQDINGYADTIDFYDFEDHDDVAYYTTSGTTSNRHKIVVYSHQSLTGLIGKMKYLTPGSTVLCPARLSFVVGLLVTIMVPWLQKTTHVLWHLPASGLRQVHEVINQHKVTHFFTAPSVLKIINKNSRATFGQHLTHVYSSGEPLPLKVAQDFFNKFKLPLINVYGSTETLCSVLFNDGTITGLGQPINNCDVLIVDENNKECPVGTPGRLIIKTASRAARYYDDPESSADAFRGAWYYTGDVFVKNTLSDYEFVDRIDQYVKIKGSLTSALDIEELVTRLPGVIECSVVFDKSQDGFIKSLAFIVKENQTSLKDHDIRAGVNKLSNGLSNMIPDEVFFVSELPKTYNNKKIKALPKLREVACLSNQITNL